MKELNDKAKNDNIIMAILKVNELGHVIAVTDKGPLVMRLNKEGKGKDYRFILDAVPLEDKKNKELVDLFYGSTD